MAIDPPVTKHQIEVAAQLQREASTTAEERRVWTEDQMKNSHQCVSRGPSVFDKEMIPVLLQRPPCNGTNCGSTDHRYHSRECVLEHEQVARPEGVVRKEHSHYYKDVSTLSFIDVYRVLHLFNVSDPCLQHAIKKLLVAGGRGAGKDINKDVREAQDSLARFLEMRDEDSDEYAGK